MEVSRSIPSLERARVKPEGPLREWLDISILCFVNVINYCDRYTLATHIPAIQDKFDIKNDMAGLLQSTFVFAYMIIAPVFGYLGDRYNRRLLMALGVVIWNTANLASSFVTRFWPMLLLRGLAGIGQSSYTTIAPTLISDLFVGDDRSKMLALFYLAIPFGNGLGYIVGSLMAKWCGSWEWSLRATPGVSLVAIVLILFVLDEPKRGHREGQVGNLKPTSVAQDIKYLFTNRSYVLSTIGFTCMAFTSGALSWWGPKLTLMGIRLHEGAGVNGHLHGSIFGLITALSGMAGLAMGYYLSHTLRARYPKVDPIVCATGLFISVPFLIGLTYASCYNTVLCYMLLFFGQVMINLNWAIICDILLYVVLPTRRSIAVGFQLLVGHGFGNAESPYLLGLLADVFMEGFSRNGHFDRDLGEFRAIQYSFFVSCGVEIFGGLFFMLNACYILEDIRRIQRAS